MWLKKNKKGYGKMKIGGSIKRKVEEDEKVREEQKKIEKIGRMVEEMEKKIRNKINEIYFGKKKEIVNGMSRIENMEKKKKKDEIRKDIKKEIIRRKDKGEKN